MAMKIWTKTKAGGSAAMTIAMLALAVSACGSATDPQPDPTVTVPPPVEQADLRPEYVPTCQSKCIQKYNNCLYYAQSAYNACVNAHQNGCGAQYSAAEIACQNSESDCFAGC
jgi:hypothetical protein